MYLAYGVNTHPDANGNARRGWLVYHIQNAQADYLGFIDQTDYPNWSEVRTAIAGIILVGSVRVPAAEYRGLRKGATSPGRIREQGDALEGN